MFTVTRMTEGDAEAVAWMTGNAYPVMRMDSEAGHGAYAAELKRRLADPAGGVYYVAREAGESGAAPIGVMRCLDFEAYVEGVSMPFGGLASVAVDLGRKKEGIGLALVQAYLEHFRAKGVPLLGLYPFRHDFYRSMGFGYGARLRRYSVRPTQIAASEGKEFVRALGPEDAEAMRDCYEASARPRTGMFAKPLTEFAAILANREARSYGYVRGGRILGYTTFLFEPVRPDNQLLNDARVLRLFHLEGAALRGIMDFYRSQADQLRLLHFETQDDDLRFLFADPADQSGNLHAKGFIQSCLEGDGIMYRVDDPEGFLLRLAEGGAGFGGVRFGGARFGGVSLRLGLALRDPLRPGELLRLALAIEAGRLVGVDRGGRTEVELALGLADFSSLAMGAVGLGSLVEAGLAELSPPDRLPEVEAVFARRRPPQCSTYF